jgi:A/G-specific adenine glycosylase
VSGPAKLPAIAARLLAWHATAGRHDLPWQRDRSAYRVWVSEVMLQQTQVSTVIPYFDRFMRRFPDVRSLADAPDDEVLHLWTGLGYYARARNLLRAARAVRDAHAGEFPRTIEAVVELPGIGRSTAGAILALSDDQRHPILDGNVKRVLARYYAIDGAPDEAATIGTLWELADANTPATGVATYTQAIMDLGATVCTRARPRCAECPLEADCLAHHSGRESLLPAPKRRRADRRLKHAVMVVARREEKVLLVQRPPSGIWGGLWCLPEFDDRESAAAFVSDELGVLDATSSLPDIQHSFTHFDLVITPIVARCRDAEFVRSRASARVREAATLWYDLTQPERVGLPAPIQKLLGTLQDRLTEKGVD